MDNKDISSEALPTLTREDVLKGLKEANERAAKFPRVYVAHQKDIEAFLVSHADIKTPQEANEVLAYLDSLKNEWKEYYKVIPSDVYPNIHLCLASAYIALQQPVCAIEVLEACLSVIANASEYQYLFKIIANIHFWLADLYYDVHDLNKVNHHLRKGIHQILTGDNRTSYKNYAFYAFRPLRDYVLKGIRENKICLSDPATFNDPVDPALLKHLQSLISSADEGKEKDMLRLQLGIYKRVRITSLCRTYPLPTGREDDVYQADPPYSAIHKASLWGYYAQSHTGLCIKYVFPAEFTKYDPADRNEVLMLRNVVYKDSYDPQVNTFFYNDAFFAKGSDWKNECECRLVYFREQGEVETYHWKDLPAGCIQEVYIGYAASKADKFKLKEALKGHPGIRLYQMKLSSNNLFELEPELIRLEDIEDIKLSLLQQIKNWICEFYKNHCK